MSPASEKQQEAVAALVGAARMRKRIWLAVEDKATPDIEHLYDTLQAASFLVAPLKTLTILNWQAQSGDILIIPPQITQADAWLKAAQARHIRCIILTPTTTACVYDIVLGHDVAVRDGLCGQLARVDTRPQTRKIFDDWQDLRAALAGLRPLVFTNGVFDILHRGHIHALQAARNEGAYLIVGVNSDASVKRLGKGTDRPIQTAEDRIALLAALSCVDFATIFEEDTPARLIETICPDILVKGGDYQPDQIAGADFVKSRGGKVVTIAFAHERSTTQILRKIRSHDNAF